MLLCILLLHKNSSGIIISIFVQKHSYCFDSFGLKWLLSGQSDFILLITVNIVLWFVQYDIVSPPIFVKYFRIWCVSLFMLIGCDFLFYLLIYDQLIDWYLSCNILWGGVSWSSSFCVVWRDKNQSLFVSIPYCIYGPQYHYWSWFMLFSCLWLGF